MGDEGVRDPREVKTGKESSTRNDVTTVFVANIAPKLHWQGLRAAFAYHGEVVDTFIPMKRSWDGLRFGFVRFSNKGDALRAIERLNDFVLFGSRISVSLARFNARSHYWRKAPSKNLISGQNDSCNPASQETQDKQLVEGIIDTGVIEKLKTSIIGTTKVFMEPEKLIELLENKGLHEFEVRKIAGNQFLIDFDSEELFDQCLNWEWVWLPEIFFDIIHWFKGYSPGNRVTWVAIYGVPLFAWNNYTFNNILNRSVKTTPIQEKVFVSAKKMPAIEVDGSKDSGSWLPAVGFGHDCLKVSSVKDIPEAYLMPCGGYHKVEDVDSVDVMGGCCTEPLSCLGVDADGKNDIVTNQALEDIRNVGLGSELNEELYEMIPCSNVGISWAKRVDMANGNTEAYAIESEAELEQENFFPELQDLRSRRKYVSIAELQDKSLSAKEKRKRDRALRKKNKKGETENIPRELGDYSPSDLDIARM
ncbi:hypothetical protein GQ457_01G033020 [Hibiscus cannabinus]